LVPPTRTFTDRVDLPLGGITLEIHALPGHTLDSVVGYIPEWQTLLAGDSVESPLPFLYPESPVEQWIQGLEAWAEVLGQGPTTVIPSHGALGGTELLLANVQYLKDLLGGREPKLPGDVSRFYRDTHANNRSIFAA
jgi:glyoxylase-like metal-dependent hydrolase (beta-lactamase superfamily II)